jgi:hypothetical protein
MAKPDRLATMAMAMMQTLYDAQGGQRPNVGRPAGRGTAGAGRPRPVLAELLAGGLIAIRRRRGEARDRAARRWRARHDIHPASSSTGWQLNRSAGLLLGLGSA